MPTALIAAGAVVAVFGAIAAVAFAHPMGTAKDTATMGGVSTDLTLDDRTNDKTVNARPGQMLTISLASLQWTFDPVSSLAIVQVGQPSKIYQRAGCKDPQGCGTTQLRVRAVKAGKAIVRAARTSCGDAELCPPSLRHYAVTIDIR